MNLTEEADFFLANCEDGDLKNVVSGLIGNLEGFGHEYLNDRAAAILAMQNDAIRERRKGGAS